MALDRFVKAQAPVIETVLDELRAGRKRTHWMWFVFPQVAGLGSSATARYYALESLAEARAYLAHPVLGRRLEACVALVLGAGDTDMTRVLGPIDAVKLRSSLTLFEAAGGAPVFADALDHLFGGERDPRTLELLA